MAKRKAPASTPKSPAKRTSGPSGPSPTQEERRERGLPLNISIALYPDEIEALDEARGSQSRARYLAAFIPTKRK